MHLGMKKKAHERVSKQVQEAKDLGTYTKTYHNEIKNKEQALSYSISRAASKKPKIDKGIIGSVGKWQHGVMKVSKKVIESVEGNKKSFGKKSFRGGGGKKSQQKIRL